MNEKIRAWAEEKHQASPSSGNWARVRYVDDITAAGIKIEDRGITGLYGQAIYAALARMLGETSPRVLNGHSPCDRPEYIEYRMKIKAAGDELYPHVSRRQ